MTQTLTTTQSKASTPAEVLDLLRQALDSGDLDAAAALFEPEATFIPPAGDPVTGTDAIRSALEALFVRRPSFTNRVHKILRSGDLALTYPLWTIRDTDDNGEPVEETGQGHVLVRRQPDESWLIAIDNPSGNG